MTLQEYLQKSYSERHTWFFYKNPIKQLDFDFFLDRDWEKYIQKTYPIQYFFREEIYRTIRNYFFPRRKWLLKVVPNFFCDKSELIPTLLIACLIDLVEGEKYFERVSSHKDKDCPENQAKFGRELEKNYYRVKEELPVLESRAQYEWGRIDEVREKLGENANYNEIYGRVNELEEKINKLKSEVCHWVISNRGGMWT